MIQGFGDNNKFSTKILDKMKVVTILLSSTLLINAIEIKMARYLLVKVNENKRTGKLFYMIDNSTYEN